MRSSSATRRWAAGSASAGREGSARPQALDEAAGRCVEVQQTDRLEACVTEAVDRARRRGDERPRPGHTRFVTDPELDLSFEHVERVNVVDVRVGVDALELRLEGHVDRGQLWQVAKDPVDARLVFDRL